MKKLSKISLLNDAKVLSEHEMKMIIGGSGGCNPSACGGPCTVTINKLVYSGKCTWNSDTGTLLCPCKVH